MALFVTHSPMLGLPAISFGMVMGGAELSVTSEGNPLELTRWQQQFSAWWHGWSQHWEGQGERDPEGVLVDTIIPVAEDQPREFSYSPPGEPVVLLEPHDLPAELLQPVEGWFESAHTHNGVVRAQVSANLDYESAAQARVEEEGFQRDFGRWPYARQIDRWWWEGPHEVVVRGVEHMMPDEDDPPENDESVWSFRLRQRRDAWVIRTWSQGWPRYGSAPADPSSEGWCQRWTSGSLER